VQAGLPVRALLDRLEAQDTDRIWRELVAVLHDDPRVAAAERREGGEEAGVAQNSARALVRETPPDASVEEDVMTVGTADGLVTSPLLQAAADRLTVVATTAAKNGRMAPSLEAG
jgi:hypothetical protein